MVAANPFCVFNCSSSKAAIYVFSSNFLVEIVHQIWMVQLSGPQLHSAKAFLFVSGH